MLSCENQSRSNYQQCLQINRHKVLANEQKAKERKRAAEAITILEARQLKLKERVRKELSDIGSEIGELEQSKKRCHSVIVSF